MYEIKNCKCGHEHRAEIEVISEVGAINKIPEILNPYNKPFVIGDVNTYNNNFDCYESFVFEDKELVPDERTVGRALIAIPKDCDILIAVGSGTLNDISRYLSYRLGIPYIIVATAPSMDGYASSVSPLIVDNMKITYQVTYPKFIIADIDIVKNAPHEMIIAGVGDILGKYTCLCDWELSHIINGEYYCENISDLVRTSIKKCVDNIDGLMRREEEAVKNVMDGLILSGIAMSYAGNSRPASGAEHHLSHFWEMDYLFKNKKAVLHGIKVGLATPVIAELYTKIKTIDINACKIKEFEFDTWSENIKKVYRGAAQGVISLEKTCHKNSTQRIKTRYESYVSNWDSIRLIMDKVPSKKDILNILQKLNAPTSLGDIGLDKETFYNSIISSKDLRDRYTIMEMASDLNLSEKLAEGLFY